jgi:hypothetical protein
MTGGERERERRVEREIMPSLIVGTYLFSYYKNLPHRAHYKAIHYYQLDPPFSNVGKLRHFADHPQLPLIHD